MVRVGSGCNAAAGVVGGSDKPYKKEYVMGCVPVTFPLLKKGVAIVVNVKVSGASGAVGAAGAGGIGEVEAIKKLPSRLYCVAFGIKPAVPAISGRPEAP
jgi:hypothetical protein